ncbi:MAG TPA: amidohydrolase family protein [Micromonosporaceae bacterium]|nr:amidohydrolase family protein [Micromonosporaceae bacterium]
MRDFILPEYGESLRLIDHHCHGVVRRDLDRPAFEAFLTEADPPLHPTGVSLFDSQIGFAVRRWCPPVLDLPAHTTPEAYLARRAELGVDEVNRRFLTAARLDAVCVDTGFAPEPILSPAELGAAAGATPYQVIRLEQLAESVIQAGCTADGFADAVPDELERAKTAIAVKSIAAYRTGLDFPGERPTHREVTAAAARILRDGAAKRIADPVLHRFLIWASVDAGKPIQIHIGYGDRDIDLHRSNPLLLTPLLRAIEPTGVPVMLLHNYPFHREAGYLAQIFSNVFIDVGLATHNVGQRASALLAEALELAPFGKVLFSSDAYGLPELFHLGALLFRRALVDFLRAGVSEDAWTEDDALRIAEMAGSGTARRVYRIP